MKKRYLLNLMVALLVLPIGAKAQEYVEYSPQGMKANHSGFKVVDYSNGHLFDKSKCDVKQCGNYKVYKEKRSRTLRRKEVEDGVTLSFNVVFDPTYYSVSEISIFNEKDYYWINPEYNEEEGYDYFPEEVSTTVAPGTYDIFMIFTHYPTTYYVILENVEVVDGSYGFYLSPELATNHISFKYFNSEGEELRHSVGHWDEEMETWVSTEEGNVSVTCAETRIIKKGGNQIYKKQGIFFFDMSEDDDPTLTEGTDFYINDVSDYLFVQTRTDVSPSNVWYVNQLTVNDVHEGCIKNDPSKYVLSEETMEVSPDGKKNKGWGSGIVRVTYLDGQLKSTDNLTNGDYEAAKEDETLIGRIYVNMSSVNPKENLLVTLLCTSIYDHVAPVITDWGDVWDELMGINGPLFQINNGEKEFVGIHIGPDSGLPVGPFNVWTLPENTPFTYKADNVKGNLAGNTPINALVIKNTLYPESDVVSLYIDPNYVGRFGETRLGDGASIETSLKFNGEEIANPSEWNPESNGVVDFAMKNTNILVDGLQGTNTTTIHFDMANKDNIPPTIQMLQFRDSEGYITDRFSQADNGIMELTAADCNYFLNTETWENGFDYQPISITVEYSPYGKDNWSEIQIEEIPELYNENGWGYFYRASLKDVEGAGEKGWFDIRFSMSDATGNTHVQTVSPAFRIDDKVDTGIGNNNQYTITNKQEVYDLMGRKVGNGSRLLDNGYCNKGISIVRRANGDVRKVVNK